MATEECRQGGGGQCTWDHVAYTTFTPASPGPVSCACMCAGEGGGRCEKLLKQERRRGKTMKKQWGGSGDDSGVEPTQVSPSAQIIFSHAPLKSEAVKFFF